MTHGRRRVLSTAVIIAMAGLMGSVASPAIEVEVGPRAMVSIAGGEPANDIMSAGVYAKFRLSERWRIGTAIDFAAYDFERPAKLVGLRQDESVGVIDADTSAMIVSTWVEQWFGGEDNKWRWFWTGGIGFSSPDVDDAMGPLEGGGTFNITTDPGTETILSVGGGVRRAISKRWAFDLGLKADHHIADWEVMDRVSGNRGTVDSYTAWGAYGGLTYRFGGKR